MKLIDKRVFVVVFSIWATCFLVVAHAGLREQAPSRGDPFAGILDRSKLAVSSAATLSPIHDKLLAVILSDNTEKHLKWSNDVTGGLTGADNFFKGLFGGEKAQADSKRLHKVAFAPEAVVNSVVEPLVRKAKSVKVIPDMAEFRTGKFDLLVLLDVTFVNNFSDGFFGGTYESGTYINAFVIDRGNTLRASIAVGETRPVIRDRFLYIAAEIRQEMVARYQVEVDKVLGPDRLAANASGLVNQPPASATKKSTADRIREIDDLRKQGLITPDEAESKRKKILDDI